MSTAAIVRDYLQELGPQLRIARGKRRQSQRAAALELGMAHTQVVDIEVGRANLTTQSLDRVLAYIDDAS
jgi:hypothetical protein